jgi:hypothetical protein
MAYVMAIGTKQSASCGAMLPEGVS